MINMEDGDARFIRYSLKFDDGTVKDFAMNFDKDTLSLLPHENALPGEWTRLEFEKCPNCSLDPATHAHCPVALNLSELIVFIKDMISYEEVDVVVEVPERKYSGRVALQTASSSLIGIIMATSGCPVLDRLRPMVQTHLPFATWEETSYRVVTMYLFSQYFRYKEGGKPDWDLDRLVELFDEIELVNLSFSQRIEGIRKKDASVNAVAILSCFGSMTRMSVSENMFDHWKTLLKT